MTQSPPSLTDRTALLRNRARAYGMADPALFLQLDAADEVHERLTEVNRTFTAPAVVSGCARVWGGLLPGVQHLDDTDLLTLEPGAHDLVVHGLALHWANDPVGQLVQCRRALKPDGLFLGVMFGGDTLHELRAALAEAEIEQTGGLSPRVAPMAELRDLGGLLQRAGFALPVSDSARRMVTYPSAMHLMRDLRAMGEGNALAQRHRKPVSRKLFDRAAEIYHKNFALPDGRIPATFETIFLTGWAPDTSQPQPLKPGSATTRLEDALNMLRDTSQQQHD